MSADPERGDGEAASIIALLNLVPHPEGGHYRETFRDSAVDGTGRAASTAIYYLLQAGEISRWHKVDAVEIWHWHKGAALELRISVDGTTVTTVRLGADFAAGEAPQCAVPAGTWQAARSLGDYSLVGCTVAPGFQFSGFEMADAVFPLA